MKSFLLFLSLAFISIHAQNVWSDMPDLSLRIITSKGEKYTVLPSKALIKVGLQSSTIRIFKKNIPNVPTISMKDTEFYIKAYANKINFPISVIKMTEENKSLFAAFTAHKKNFEVQSSYSIAMDKEAGVKQLKFNDTLSTGYYAVFFRATMKSTNFDFNQSDLTTKPLVFKVINE